MDIRIEYSDELTEEEQNQAGIIAELDDMVKVAIVTYDDGEVRYLTDKIEPEDCTMDRDLGAFLSEIQHAYKKGKDEGFDNGYNCGHAEGFNEGQMDVD